MNGSRPSPGAPVATAHDDYGDTVLPLRCRRALVGTSTANDRTPSHRAPLPVSLGSLSGARETGSTPKVLEMDHPLVAALALGDEQRPFGDLDVGQAQAEHFAAPQPPSTMAKTMARSRWVRKTPTSASTSPGERIFATCGAPTQRHRLDSTATPASGEPLRHRVRLTDVSPRATR